MKINQKIYIQYGLSLIVNTFIGWLTVSSLQSILPTSITHDNVPEVPPELIADWILIIGLIILMSFFSWGLEISFNSPLSKSRDDHRILKIINVVWAVVTLISFAIVSLVVNDGTLSDLANNLTLISTIGNVVLLLFNFGLTIKNHQLFWYRWSLCFQILLIITFWLNLWISPV